MSQSAINMSQSQSMNDQLFQPYFIYKVNGCEAPHDNNYPIILPDINVLRIELPDDYPMNDQSIHYIFTIDVSASMTELCKDMNTKFYHCKSTLKNLLSFLYEEIYMSDHPVSTSVTSFEIITFESSSKVVLPKTHLPNDQTEFEELLCRIDQSISEDGSCTNIESAFHTIHNSICQPKETSIVQTQTQIVQIFMTDGDITSGETDQSNLISILENCLVENNVLSYFIGFGTDHNSSLLRNFCQSFPKSEYFVVDSIENSDLVYSEIIHSILYAPYTDIELGVLASSSSSSIIESIEFYDWKLNLWTSKLYLGRLVAGSHRDIHFRYSLVSSSQADVSTIGSALNKTIQMTGKYTVSGITIAPNQIRPYGLPIIMSPSAMTTTDQDVRDQDVRDQDVRDDIRCYRRYQYRQLVMEYQWKTNDMLRRISHSNPYSSYDLDDDDDQSRIQLQRDEEEQLKENLRSLFQMISDYYEEEFKPDEIESNNAVFIKQLIDDLYIAIHSLECPELAAYSASRHMSQGNQTNYSCATQDLQTIIDTQRVHGNSRTPNIFGVGSSSPKTPMKKRNDHYNHHYDDDTTTPTLYWNEDTDAIEFTQPNPNPIAEEEEDDAVSRSSFETNYSVCSRRRSVRRRMNNDNDLDHDLDEEEEERGFLEPRSRSSSIGSFEQDNAEKEKEYDLFKGFHLSPSFQTPYKNKSVIKVFNKMAHL